MTPREVIGALEGAFGGAVHDPVEFRGDWAVGVEPARLLEVCRHLRDRCAFAMLTDLSGVDHYGEEPRFEVSYILYSFEHRCWLRLRVRVPEGDPEVDSVTGVWATADWHEREAWDMYGLRFRGHPNLQRILMWEGYPHHPLRKDFPLAGRPADLPDTAVGVGRAEIAPMLGGPFVSSSSSTRSLGREPRQFDTQAEQADQGARPPRAEDV